MISAYVIDIFPQDERESIIAIMKDILPKYLVYRSVLELFDNLDREYIMNVDPDDMKAKDTDPEIVELVINFRNLKKQRDFCLMAFKIQRSITVVCENSKVCLV